jgi:hypothetical protein
MIRPSPERPAKTAPLAEKAHWLLLSYGYCKANDTVVDLYEPSEECEMKPSAFRSEFKAWREITLGPLKGKHVETATARWEVDEDRLSIKGVRMRPDKPFPVYEEDGAWFKNTYRAPAHVGDGDVAAFLTYMDRFIPNKSEREYLFNWLAHKQMRPDIPGVAVLLVAAAIDGDGVLEGAFGTGRGLFFKILAKLYRERYARPEDFSVISSGGGGGAGQGVFTDWRAYSILTTVDEAQVSPTAYRRGERRSVYEVLKDVIDPAPKPCRFKVKYGKPFYGIAYNSFIVASNHIDAVSIPKNDRRITVLRNGRVMTEDESNTIAAWMQVPGNIAALSRWLAKRDLSNFNMYRPLHTAAKDKMAELSLSVVDEAMLDMANDNERGLVFTRPHFQDAVELMISGGRGLPAYFHGLFDNAFPRFVTLLKTKQRGPARISVKGNRIRLYCFHKRLKEAKQLTEAQRRHHATKWGLIDELKKELKALQGGLTDIPNKSSDSTKH